MIITVASFKGGVGKTTTAVHLAAYLAQSALTALIDGDPNHSASGWAQRGNLPFRVVDERQSVKVAREVEHLVIDTQARPTKEDLSALAEGCDLLVLPTTPDVLSLDALGLTLDALRSIGANQWRILLTMIPPKPSHDGDEAKAYLLGEQLPVFTGGIRRAAVFQRAALQGVPVNALKDARAQTAWQDYVCVGEELQGR